MSIAILAYDWRYTLAESDLPKVCGTTRLAGCRVGFPFLDDDLLVDFSLRLPTDYKLKGLEAALVLQGGAARFPARRNHHQEETGLRTCLSAYGPHVTNAEETRQRIAAWTG